MINSGFIDFSPQVFSIFIVLVLQNVLAISVNLADNLMLGSYREAALSGAAVVNQIQFVFQMIVAALGDGSVILCSQYWGKQETDPMKKIGASAMRTGLCIGILLMLAASLFPEQILRVFTTDPGILRQGCDYLRIIRFTYPLFAATTILLSFLRGAGVVRIALVLSVTTLIINCGINSVLIYGRFGAPELGITGAAIGTLCARTAEVLILVLYIRYGEKRLKLRPRDFLKTDARLTGDYLRVTAPVVFVQALWGLNIALQTVILGHMTPAAIAANSVASTLMLLMKSAVTGAASTASIIIGTAIGTGDLARVKRLAVKLQKLFLVIGLAGGAALFFLRLLILRLYHLSPETMQMADRFLIILSVIFVFTAYQMPTNTGIIRGGGSPGFIMKVDIVCIWMIVLPLSFFMAFVVKADPAVVICCLNADQVIKCIPGFLKVNYGHWIRQLTRE